LNFGGIFLYVEPFYHCVLTTNVMAAAVVVKIAPLQLTPVPVGGLYAPAPEEQEIP